jgi:hypothetical protein
VAYIANGVDTRRCASSSGGCKLPAHRLRSSHKMRWVLNPAGSVLELIEWWMVSKRMTPQTPPLRVATEAFPRFECCQIHHPCSNGAPCSSGSLRVIPNTLLTLCIVLAMLNFAHGRAPFMAPSSHFIRSLKFRRVYSGCPVTILASRH